MKPSTVVMASLLGILTGTVVVTEAGWNQISINDSGINFTVRRYDDGRAVPYQLIFKANNIKSTYDIRVDGSVHLLKAGKEKYEVRYNGDGSIKKVVRQDNGARMLWHDELDKEDFSALEDPIDEDIPLEDMFSTEYRRLTSSYACEDCEEAWDVVCGPALAYICELTGNAVLGTAGAQSVEIACDQFGNLCDSLSADEACKGHCVEGKMTRRLLRKVRIVRNDKGSLRRWVLCYHIYNIYHFYYLPNPPYTIPVPVNLSPADPVDGTSNCIS